MNDEDILDYINEYILEQYIRKLEYELLHLMKIRNEKFPCKKNDSEWLDYANFVCSRVVEDEEGEIRDNEFTDVPLHELQLEFNKRMSKVLDAMENRIK